MDGGDDPRWSVTGREIFYVSGYSYDQRRDEEGYKIWAVPVTTTPSFQPGVARILFERLKRMRGYDVTPDGQHFIVAEETEPNPEPLQIVVVPNWFDELKAKVPVPR
jgi:hypothetical protein